MTKEFNGILWNPIKKAIREYRLIDEGDVVGIGLSGGKDSMVLLYALDKLRKTLKYKFEIIALTLDLGFSNNYETLIKYCNENEIKHNILQTDIAEIVFNDRAEKNPCSLCAKMRRGALNNFAKSLGCNKLALGHHSKDAIETFFLSLIFEGRISCFQPRSYLDRSDITIIRPLVLVSEENIIKVKERINLPEVKNNCPAEGHTKRDKMGSLLTEISGLSDLSETRILGAIVNHLWTE